MKLSSKTVRADRKRWIEYQSEKVGNRRLTFNTNLSSECYVSLGLKTLYKGTNVKAAVDAYNAVAAN